MQRPLLILFLASLAADPATAAEIEFNRDIRPILSENCFFCHGPDRKKRKGGVQLDLRDAALKPTKDGARPIIPGDPKNSAVMQRILSDDPDLQMPPPDSTYALTDAQKDLLRRWIESGAEYQTHWAYVPPKSVPEVATDKLIDRLINDRLAEHQVKPSPQADPQTLVRRLHLDLTGLPPTPAAVDAFVANPSDAHYREMVEGLLASPHFGERMAVKWLDLVRYADTHGYHSDDERYATPYRDYVINAFNQNKPFDRFTIEQLAGDLLPDPGEEQLIATGYNRLNQVTGEGGANGSEYLVKYRADRVRNISSVWLGSSMGCAECHDHKYDPFLTEDFYRMAAFFADVDEPGLVSGRSRGNAVYPPTITVHDDAQRQSMTDLRDQIDRLKRSTDVDETAFQKWLTTTRSQLDKGASWLVVPPTSVAALHGSKLEVQADDSVKSTGKNPDSDDYVLRLPLPAGTYTGIRLQVLPDPDFKNRYGKGGGNYVLSEFQVALSTSEDLKPEPLAFADAKADYTQGSWKIEGTYDGKPNTGWAGNGHKETGKTRTVVYRFANPVKVADGHAFEIRMLHQTSHPQHNIGRFRLAVTTQADPHAATKEEISVAIRELLARPNDQWTPAQRDQLAKAFLASNAGNSKRDKAIAKLQKDLDALERQGRITLVTKALAKPREVRVLPRGNWMDNSGEIVTPDVPAIFGSIRAGDTRATRLDFANWIVARDNPLTARVMVNHLWNLFFGTGLSKVLDDLGSQGEWPTHPELLDSLAVTFMDSGWNVKDMVRLIVSSETYKRASNGRPELDEIDPNNRLWARQQPLRLDAEFVRDLALATSGLLERRVGGNSVRYYQPAGYWSDSYKRVGVPHTYTQDHGKDLYRRGLYTFWKRTYVHPAMLAFDAPTREECTASRSRSNTPLQALVLLNDVTFVEAARALAERAIREGGPTADARLDWLYRTVLARQPEVAERQLLQDHFNQQLERYQASPKDAAQLLSEGESPVPSGLPSTELAAWTAICRTLLNLHETIVRY